MDHFPTAFIFEKVSASDAQGQNIFPVLHLSPSRPFSVYSALYDVASTLFVIYNITTLKCYVQHYYIKICMYNITTLKCYVQHYYIEMFCTTLLH